jgi:hypothetical protein
MTEHEHLKDKTVKNPPKKHERKSYINPRLIEYGKIERLTESGGSKRNDGGPHSRP